MVVSAGALGVASAGAFFKSDAPIPPGCGGRSNADLAAVALASTGLHTRRVKPRIALTLFFSLSCGYCTRPRPTVSFVVCDGANEKKGFESYS